MAAIEIPAAYLDDLELDAAAARPALMNRDPEPNEEGVARTSNVTVEITDVGPDGISLADTKVYLDGVLAFDAGTFQAGFTGPASAHSTPQPDTLRVVIDPTADFASEAVVDVRVVSEVVGGAFAIDETYSFTVEDTTAPVVVSGVAIDFQRVRVTFDDPMLREDRDGVYDALNPQNYAVDRVDVPAAEVDVVTVEHVSPAVFDLLTDVPLSPGRQYLLTVVNVKNESGTAIGSPNTADVDGFQPAPPTGRAHDLFKMWPAMNRREDATGELRAFSSCLQEVADLLLAELDVFQDRTADVDVADGDFLDAILLDLGDPFGIPLTVERKRLLARCLVPFFQERGSERAVVDAVRLICGREVTVQPYLGGENELGVSLLDDTFVLNPSRSFLVRAFDVQVAGILTAAEKALVRRVARLAKAVNTHLVDVLDDAEPVVEGLGVMELGSDGSDGTFELEP